MARGRKTSLMIRLTPAERQTLLAWQRATTISAGRARRGRVSYSSPIGCQSPTLPPRSGSAVALSTNGCSGLRRQAWRGWQTNLAEAIGGVPPHRIPTEQHA